MKRPEQTVSEESLAKDAEQLGFGVAMLDPHGERWPGLEALMYKIAALLKRSIPDEEK